MPHPFHVVTGGPGSGKTSLLRALAGRGHRIAPEAGRAIIRTQAAIGGTARPDRDPSLFAELMLSWDLRSFTETEAHGGPVFFDRGIADSIGYLGLCGRVVPEHFWNAARKFRYAPRVFAAPPWRAIYKNDGERRQDFSEAVATHDRLVATYRELGYEIVPLPLAPVGDRVAFVLCGLSA